MRDYRRLAILFAFGLSLGARLDLAIADTDTVDWSSAQVVTVQLVNDRFVPDKLAFRRGVPYRLHLENNGTLMHEFTAPAFFKDIRVRNPEVLEQGHEEPARCGYTDGALPTGAWCSAILHRKASSIRPRS